MCWLLVENLDGHCIFLVQNELFLVVIFNGRCIMLIQNGWLDASDAIVYGQSIQPLLKSRRPTSCEYVTTIEVCNEQPGIVNYEYGMSTQNLNNQLVVVILNILLFLPGTSHVDKRWCCASPICVFLKNY